MKKDVNASGIALGLTFLIVSVVCLLLVLIAPGFALSLFGSFMHGIDITKIAITPGFDGRTILGFIVVFISGYLIGAVFASIYNKFVK
ncbi:hypothetical protein HYV88_01050 [Candidatus Woesearchaeota archaeon]|nr:hypothetical protein [Candidatus Woesearchaeota archaeon]